MTRRAQIIEAAERLLQHYGPHKTTVADIAREAGVGVGTVYLEFDSKDAIIAEVSVSRYGAVLTAMADALEGPGDAGERLQRCFMARLEGFVELSKAGAHGSDLVHCGCPGVELSHALFLERERAMLEGFLASASAEGALSVPDVRETSLVLLRVYATFAPPTLFDHPLDEQRAALAALHRLVMAGLLPR